ncbi:flavin reductase family protein [Paenibacillus methanolicus]|uniref:Flavin reductase (DIM6/NTAB) family NADH-FMN oxidoreductase RutF n=1 Tax=Paenibacillus methanolicus TaxID=582686 RepID=A0A5S5BP15_9BACL|nr:flavin reductase family protein [Paenibacillus methanolicus]TYP68935.1 flavin reductase (DIM6/NTAB) family NADH-FMN oxidoreductase RutF [Paenibacillus methanolicus]
MITIDPALHSERDVYKLMIGSVVPRPIAWVTTLSENGVLNAAPFSYFSIVSSNPPLLGVSVQRKGGEMKDTARNTIARGELVIHIVDEDNVAQANATAASLPPEESEAELAGLTAVPSEAIAVPGLAEAKIRMECVLDQVVPLSRPGETEPTGDLLIARVVRFHVSESVYQNGRIDAGKLQPVSRMAGHDYASLGRLFSIDRPT